MTSKYIPVMLLGNEKYVKEPEKIDMKKYNLNVEGDEDIPIQPRHIALQKVLDDYADSSSIDNGSLCELNCIPCYNGDKHSQSYHQKLKYYTTVGKDECPRIFDIHQYLPLNEQQGNSSSPLKSISYNNNHHEYLSVPPTIPLNNNLNVDNNESYYSDTSMETNTTLNIIAPNESTIYIKTYPIDDEMTNIKVSIKNTKKETNPIKKTLNMFKKSSYTPSPIHKEIKSEVVVLNQHQNPTKDTVEVSEIVKNIDALNIDTKISSPSSTIYPSDEVNENENKQHKNTTTTTTTTTTNITNTNTNTTTKKHKSKSNVSKYDFVKVLVYLSGKHYYVLSRFLISRMLTATQVDYYHAVRIALDLKKRLVDCNELELSQKKLEKYLFNIMEEYGYNEKYTLLYKLISGFYRERIPMIILISGPRCVGKSTLATKLAERLNLPNIVKTDTVYDLMCSIFDVPEEDREPIWYRNCSTDELLEKYEKDCELVKKGLEADIKKAFTEGKSIIIEGTHVNHLLYDFVLDCITKFNTKTENNNKSATDNTNESYTSKLLSTNNNPCNAVVLPFYLDMDDKKCHKEFLFNQIMTETIINNQNNSNYFMLNDFPKNSNLGNDQLCEFELKLDIIGNLFRKENNKRQYLKSPTGESKAFKYINVESKSFQSTLDLMHTEVLNKIQEKFSISE